MLWRYFYTHNNYPSMLCFISIEYLNFGRTYAIIDLALNLMLTPEVPQAQ